MAYDFCLGCGVMLAPHVYDCPICGFDNSFGEDQDFEIEDDVFNHLAEDGYLESESDYD
mgnify:FL=1